MKKSARTVLWAVFIIYCAGMLVLLFDRPSRMGCLEYWQAVRANLNLTPFDTVKLFWDNYGTMPVSAIVNLAGNVAVFIPAGLLLPCLFKKQRNAFIFSATVIIAVILIEITQLFTMTGSCDIDDLILNYLGAIIGFLIFQIPAIKKRAG